jgi:ABC-type phosphate transport system auxiliary subunit
MNINSTVSSSIIRTVKSESGLDNTSGLLCDLIKRNQEYEQEIIRLQKTHDQQIYKFCNELEKSSLLIHQYEIELDLMRVSLNLKEKQLKNENSESFIQDLETKNIELITENTKLKKELSILTTKYQTLFKEMEDAQQYVLKMIASLD